MSGMAAALRVNRFFTAVWPGYQLPYITSLSWKKTHGVVPENQSTPQPSGDLPSSLGSERKVSWGQSSLFNVVSADTPGRSEDGALHRLLQARELCCHCVFENRCCWRQCPSVNNVMPRLEYWAGRAYVARWPTMEKGRWKAIISTWSPVEPNASWELLGGQLLALNRGRKMCAGRERQEIRHWW